MKEVTRFLQSLAPDVKSGRIVAINPTRPEPPTRGTTAWVEENTQDPQVHPASPDIH
jgi:hypothetical protein